MTVNYNGSANRALNHLGKNDKARSKSLAKVASGMKINSAADDASIFSISSRMRVKLRALDQDAQNVQNGSAILRTAEGGIQGQIDLLRTIRAKVLDAANDSNTDEDRQTIQKELRHLYEQMENLAYDTDYNSKKPLLADKIVRLNEGYWEEINRTKLNLIRDTKYEVLDKVYGPFAAFTEYSSATTTWGRRPVTSPPRLKSPRRIFPLTQTPTGSTTSGSMSTGEFMFSRTTRAKIIAEQKFNSAAPSTKRLIISSELWGRRATA